MTKRSRLYFKLKWAYRAIATAKGRRLLAEKGLHPFSADVTSTMGLSGQYDAYFIDAGGDVVGMAVKKKGTVTLKIVEPEQVHTHYNVKFEFTFPNILNDLP